MFIGNLPYDAHPDELAGLLSAAGPLSDLRLRGAIAFADYANPEDAPKAA